MWRNNDALFQKVSPLLHGRRQRFFHLITNMPALSITADQDFQLDLWQTFEQRRVPGLGATFHWRDIAAILIIAGKTEPHRHNRDLGGIEKIGFVQL